jgi:hypothetical protein
LSADLVAMFRDADTTNLPDISSIDDPRLGALWILRLGQDRASVPLMTPGEVSTVLRDVYGIALARQKIEGMLANERQAVAKRKKNGRRAYQIMQAGIDEIEGISSSVLLIEPARVLTSLRATEAILNTLNGTVKVCDPYVDARTLDLLGECGNAQAIRLLTMNVNNPNKLRRDARAFVQQYGIALEVRVVGQRVLHDRYVIDDDGMLLFGTSLNGIGFKQSFVVSLGEDIRASVLTTFDSYWKTATTL